MFARNKIILAERNIAAETKGGGKKKSGARISPVGVAEMTFSTPTKNAKATEKCDNESECGEKGRISQSPTEDNYLTHNRQEIHEYLHLVPNNFFKIYPRPPQKRYAFRKSPRPSITKEEKTGGETV